MDSQDKQEITMALFAVKDREENAVERLYELVGHTIRYIAFKYLRNVDDAEDLEQDFWADIYRIADKFFFLKNGFGYICKVMNNMAVNRYKKLHRTNRIEVAYVDYTQIDGTGFNCVSEIDELILIREEMGKLEEKERIILQLTYFEDMTIMQIARELKMSKSVVGRIKIAAINKLKKEFENKKLLWIMRDYRRESGIALEKVGKFYADNDRIYIGYYEDEIFKTKFIYPKK